MRATVVDTLATVVFFTILAALTELFVAGMDPGEVLRIRLVMMPLMVLTGRPYGIWRDWFFIALRPTASWSRAVTDSIAFLSFQLPVYALVLFAVGADRREILTTLASASILMFLVSRPFGLYLETVRRHFGPAKIGTLPRGTSGAHAERKRAASRGGPEQTS